VEDGLRWCAAPRVRGGGSARGLVQRQPVVIRTVWCSLVSCVGIYLSAEVFRWLGLAFSVVLA